MRLPQPPTCPADRQRLGISISAVATVGTTFKGAIDRLDAIRSKLQGHPSYVHLDAALFGGYLPFTPYAAEVAHGNAAAPGRYDSIAVSCDKFFGFPSPAGPGYGWPMDRPWNARLKRSESFR